MRSVRAPMHWTAKSIASLGLCATALTMSGNTAIAATFEIVGGAPLSVGSTPFYGSALSQNNVVNSPGASPTGAAVFDPTGPNLTPDTPWVQGGQLVAHTGSSSFTAISWYFLGSESGFEVAFHSAALADFTEGNQNNSAYSGSPPITIGVLGSQLNVGSGPIQFSLTWANGSIDNSALQPSPGSGVPTLIFSYATFVEPDLLVLTKSVSDIIIFALNDGGAGNDHDDFVGAAIITERADCECTPTTQPTPIPGALLLFGSALGGGLLLHRWRKRRSAMARAITG